MHLFSGGFCFTLFVLLTVLSIPCGIVAFILYYWNRDHIFNSVSYFTRKSKANFLHSILVVAFLAERVETQGQQIEKHL